MELEEIRNAGMPVIIFGAGFAGQVLLNVLRDEQIEVAAFCDNKQNYAGSKINECLIVHSNELHTKFPEALFIVSAADIKDVVDQLEDLGYKNWVPGGLLLNGADIGKHDYDAEYEFLEYAVSTCVQCHNAFSSPDQIFLRSVDIVITERCSLKCKDCSNLMQYYLKPENYEADEIVETIDNFLSMVDKVNEFRVIGGEPFMNKEIHRTIDRLTDDPKIGRVIIYTNATIVPKGKNLESLKHPSVMLMITDYEELSRNHNKLLETMEENGIAYHTAPAQNWTDCTSIEKHNRTTEQQTALFKACCAKALFTLMDGKFYRCPFSAHIDKLGATPHFEDDYVDFLGKKFQEVSKEDVRNYIFHKPFINGCDFCVGRFLSDEKIVPGIQTAEPLPYKAYR